MNKNIKLILTITLFLLIDLISKYFFYNQEKLADTFLFEPAFNYGVAWSMPVPYFIIYLVWFVVVAVLLWSYNKKYITFWPTVLIIAWALWNIYDRIFLWWVRDFINIWTLPIIWPYPIFNLADVFLLIWVIFVIILEFTQKTSEKK